MDKMNDHEKATRYTDLHEHRLQLLGEIAEAQRELIQVQGEMTEILGEMGTVGIGRVFELLGAK